MCEASAYKKPADIKGKHFTVKFGDPIVGKYAGIIFWETCGLPMFGEI
jgi:hypothetical protein